MTSPTDTATDPHADPQVIETLAARLDSARRTGEATPQLTADHELTVDDAYAIQRAGVALRTAAGEAVIGAKLGLTSKAKAQQMGVADVIIGVLTDAMQVSDGGELDISHGVHPRIEPEVAFRLGRAVDAADPDADLRGAVDAIAPAMEIIDSRYRDFKFTLPDVVADNTSGSAFVVGRWVPLSTPTPALAGRSVELNIDGEVVETGLTTAILDDPWEAIPATLRMARRYGHELPSGAVILAGAATAAHALEPGKHVISVVEGLGEVSVTTGTGSR